MVSILLSVFNDGSSLRETLMSVVRQSYPHWEIIVVDDGSTDDTFILLKELIKKIGAKATILRNDRNMGLTRSLILAADRAAGNFLARIDVGDRFDPLKLEKQVTFLEEHPDYGIVGCNYFNVFLPYHAQKRSDLPLTDTDIRNSILRKNPFAHSCVVMRTNLYRLVGGYNPVMRYSQDYDLWFRFLRVTKAANLSDQLCTRYMGDTSISNTMRRPQMWQMVKIQWKNMNKFNPKHYVYLLEPLCFILLPAWLTKAVRSILHHSLAQKTRR